jgi:hypothetical protein
MGAFNTLIVSDAPCPRCGYKQDWRIQFKYGDCWQYEYHIGEKLKWGGNDNGRNVGGRVRTDGIVDIDEKCRNCDIENVCAWIYLEENRFTSIELLVEMTFLEDYYEQL